MALIRHNRTREEMSALGIKMSTCTCDMQDAYVAEAHDWHWRDHSESPGRYPAPFHPRTDTLDTLLRALGTILGLQIEVFFMMDGRSDSWPGSREDIFGTNRIEAVTQICRWLDQYPSFQTSSARWHRARPTHPRNMVHLLNYTCDVVSTTNPPLSTHDLEWYKPPIVVLSNLIFSFLTIVDGVNTAYFYDDQAEPMLDAITRVTREIYERSEFDDDSSWTTILNRHGGSVHEKLALPHDTTRYHHEIVEGSKDQRPEAIEDRNAKPLKTALDIVRCRRVVYCSSNCQLHEVCSFLPRMCFTISLMHDSQWRHPTKPHKSICRTLKQLGDIAGFSPAARGGGEPPRMADYEFQSACAQARLQRPDLVNMNHILMQDNRIMKILNYDFSLHYTYRLS
ncbi:hypothetical protein FB45DRAFT_981626 [Roridomyces roridus]|uniref:Uncharacterized protein n=1 Tax=Roridomyces roridus TaxID=1738132 RepID=A0AAD7FE50_9AGAR|nr:hypothetical protein FB45DRAFT_981626 [Roridomyces roridus]